MNKHTIMKLIDAKTLAVAKIASDMFGVDIKDLIISYDLAGRSLGRAWIRKRTSSKEIGVKFNIDLCVANTDYILNDVVSHEIAHIVCFLNPTLGKDHDEDWQKVCVALGGKPEAVSSERHYLPSGKKKTEYVYTATCGKEIRVGAHRHNKIQRGCKFVIQSTGGFLTQHCQHYTITTGGNGSGARSKRNNQVTKSEIVRSMIRSMDNIVNLHKDSNFVDTVIERTGLSRQLAVNYVRNNVAKML